MLSDNTQSKFERLKSDLASRILDGGIVVAFSGGVDSAFLLWVANEALRQLRLSKGLLALTAVSDSMAQVERDDALGFSKSLQIEHLWIESGELENPLYAQNDGNRCYHCKSELFKIGWDVSKKYGLKWLAYGYNASDRGDVRPGHRAAQEYNVIAPLDDAGLSKSEIRELMREFKLPLSEKPASPCLSSRLMTGVEVTPDKLKLVEDLEAYLRANEMKVFRVRLHEDKKSHHKSQWIRLEVAPDEMARAVEVREGFMLKARDYGIDRVTLDLAGYRMGGGVA